MTTTNNKIFNIHSVIYMYLQSYSAQDNFIWTKNKRYVALNYNPTLSWQTHTLSAYMHIFVHTRRVCLKVLSSAIYQTWQIFVNKNREAVILAKIFGSQNICKQTSIEFYLVQRGVFKYSIDSKQLARKEVKFNLQQAYLTLRNVKLYGWGYSLTVFLCAVHLFN